MTVQLGGNRVFSSTMTIYARTGPKGDPVATLPLLLNVIFKNKGNIFRVKGNQIFHFLTQYWLLCHVYRMSFLQLH